MIKNESSRIRVYISSRTFYRSGRDIIWGAITNDGRKSIWKKQCYIFPVRAVIDDSWNIMYRRCGIYLLLLSILCSRTIQTSLSYRRIDNI